LRGEDWATGAELEHRNTLSGLECIIKKKRVEKQGYMVPGETMVCWVKPRSFSKKRGAESGASAKVFKEADDRVHGWMTSPGQPEARWVVAHGGEQEMVQGRTK